jgi:hypothetical protein
VSAARPVYAAFLGTWVLEPGSCQYEQGDPPRAGTYRIAERGDELAFRVDWTDAEGHEQSVEFGGVPDGVAVPFDGGALADALSITAVSERELRSAAFKDGVELMIAQRQLDETGAAMRVVQVVRLPDGSAPANVAIYRRRDL